MQWRLRRSAQRRHTIFQGATTPPRPASATRRPGRPRLLEQDGDSPLSRLEPNSDLYGLLGSRQSERVGASASVRSYPVALSGGGGVEQAS
jgi:hypothetical protein